MDSSVKRRLYFDHAATRFPKPTAVIDAMRQYSLNDEAAFGRGAYRSAQLSAQLVANLRREIASWIGCDFDQEISFHAGATEALNTLIQGFLRPGDHVVTTVAEHNSVLRPLRHLELERQIEWSAVGADSGGLVSAGAVLAAVRPETRLVAVVHGVNVNGVVQPIEEIGQKLRESFPDTQKPLFLTDAAQTFGHLPISVTRSGLDAVVAPGHKGGQGPLGTGFLYVRERFHRELRPLIHGGTGSRSESLEMPVEYPTSFEAGNLNVPALAGWLAGLRAYRGDTTAESALIETRLRMKELAGALYHRLGQIKRVRIIGRPKTPVLPVASLAIEGLSAADAAMILDTEFGIEARSGLHCAALIHKSIGSPQDGTLRLSCSETTSLEDLDELAEALAEISSATD